MIFGCAWSFRLLIKDLSLFYIDWERLFEVLVMIVVLSFFCGAGIVVFVRITDLYQPWES